MPNRLGRVLSLTRLYQPLWVLLSLLHAEASLAEQRGRIKHAVLSAHDLGRRVDLAQKPLDHVALRRRHEVAFVHQQHVCELQLIAEKVGDGAL
eukprot:2647999-Prymnesium_polylepis.1